MKLSALFVALVLTATEATANAESLVIAEGDESATLDQVVDETSPVLGPEVETGTSAPSTVSPEEAAAYDRLFGNPKQSPGELSKADQQTVDAVSEAAWPWWSLPLGLLAIGVLLIVRGRVMSQKIPVEAIHVISRQPMGKDGTLALVEIHDGDDRKRRLLVGLGSGAPRLVADVSAWEVAVAAPSNISNDAVALVGPDPDGGASVPPVERPPHLHVAPRTFNGHLEQAAKRYGLQDSTEEESGLDSSRADLIESVLAKRDHARLETVGKLKSAQGGRPAYSSREILA